MPTLKNPLEKFVRNGSRSQKWFLSTTRLQPIGEVESTHVMTFKRDSLRKFLARNCPFKTFQAVCMRHKDSGFTSFSESCSLSDVTRASSLSCDRLTLVSSSTLSAPLRCLWSCNISMCLSLSRTVASRLEMVSNEPACSAFNEDSCDFTLNTDKSFSCRSFSRLSHYKRERK